LSFLIESAGGWLGGQLVTRSGTWFTVKLEAAVDAEIGVIKDGVAVHTNLIIRYDLFLFTSESNSWEEGIFVNVSSNLVEDLVSYTICCQFPLFFIFEKRHLVA
jgi:hypothetical protein